MSWWATLHSGGDLRVLPTPNSEASERLPALKPLPRRTLRDVAVEALETRWRDAVTPLVEASGGNLLILQLGADYINACPKPSINLHAIPNFRHDLLLCLIDEKAIAEGVGQVSEGEVRELLDVLSILSSAPLTSEMTDLIAGFIGITPQTFGRLLDHLKREGHLERTTKDDGKTMHYRLVPDVLSDYRACAACYEETGMVRDFPSRLWQALRQPRSLLPWMLRNLSEAEYLTRLVTLKAGKVTEPLMRVLSAEYSQAGWRKRSELLDIWSSVAEFQPAESLEQIREVLRLGNDQPEEAPSEIEILFQNVSPMPSFQTTLSTCANILAIIGNKHADFTSECLSLVLEIASKGDISQLDKVAEICSLNRFGPTPAAEAAITWIRARIMNTQALPWHEKLGGLIDPMLAWAFQLKITENEWVDDKTLQFRETHRSLPSTRHFRETALEIVDSWLRSSNLSARLGAASFFRHFIVLHDVGVRSSDGGSAKDRQAWLLEQAVALSKLREVIAVTTDAPTLWAIRGMLIDALGYALQQPSGRHAIHDILEIFPDNFELRIYRLFLSSEHSDTWESEARCAYLAKCQTSSKQVQYRPDDEIQSGMDCRRKIWDDFVKYTTAEIIIDSNVGQLWEFLCKWNEKLSAIGKPNFWMFLAELKQVQPALQAGLTNYIIADDSGALDSLMPALLSLAEPGQKTLMSLACLHHKRSSLVLAALQAFRFSRNISAEEWIELRTLASNLSPLIREEVLRWAEEAHNLHYGEMEKVFEVLAAIPLKSNEAAIVDAWVRCLSAWINTSFLLAGVPHGSTLIARLIQFPDLNKHELKGLIIAWSRHAPEQCIDLLEARMAESNARASESYHAIPFALELHALDDIPSIDSKLTAAFDALKSANPQQSEDHVSTCTTWFKMLASGAWRTYVKWLDGSIKNLSGKELTLAISSISTGTLFAFSFPDLTEKLLEKADAENMAKSAIRRRLISSIHPRFYSCVPGTPRAHDVANREKALELAQQNRHRPLLYELYIAIGQSCEKQIEAAKEEES